MGHWFVFRTGVWAKIPAKWPQRAVPPGRDDGDPAGSFYAISVKNASLETGRRQKKGRRKVPRPQVKQS
jgi:hypothetical protein